jgi:3-hydroxybutyryl-CoA dehydratase
MPGKYSLIHTVETEFVKPVFIGDELTIKGTVKEKDDNFRLIWLKVVITNQKGEKVCRAKMRIGLMK